MNEFLVAVAVFLLLTILAGMFRILRGPSPADRMLAAQLFGTTGVAILLLLGKGLGLPALRDVALIFVLLGALTTVAFVKRFWRRRTLAKEER
jgi:multicomponent Na+:H+ antiporter subunit F